MSRARSENTEYVNAHRQRKRASGEHLITTFLPGELVTAIDRLKAERGERSRTPIIEAALRCYIEEQMRA